MCRHSQCDLHTSTDILLRPALASKCSQPFQPYDPATNTAAAARCCTSDVTLAEFKQLCGKMDGFNARALTAREFLAGTPAFRTDLFSRCARLVSHDESIALIDSLDRDFAPELKAYSPPPADAGGGGVVALTQAQVRDRVVQAYVQRGIAPQRVFLQSFDRADVEYWIRHFPAFAPQVVYLDGGDALACSAHETTSEAGTCSLERQMAALRARGLRILAPALWLLVTSSNATSVSFLQARTVPQR